ncbi:MAG: DegT/DnrJ/EryC1/StrS family aminotransferase, partial [Oscillospiraceae bacterium]
GFIQHKHLLYDFYKNALDGKNGFSILPFCGGIRSNKWFFSLYLGERANERDEIIAKLKAEKIQTRPVWALIHEQADYGKNEAYALDKAIQYRAGIINLPCSTNLTVQAAARVAEELLKI